MTKSMGNKGVHVTGIPELSRALKALDAEVYRQLRAEMKDIAAHVIREAQGRMEFGMGPAAASIKPSGTTKGAAIRFPAGGAGSAGDPVGMYPWLDFGGAPTGGRGVTASSKIAHRKSRAGFRRDTPDGGRYIYPAIADSRPFIEESAYDAIERAGRRAGFEVRG